MTKKISITLVILVVCVLFSFAREKDSGIIAIKSTKIIPVIGEEIPEGLILIKDGKIEYVGKSVEIPQGARIIDASGLVAYPGMIDSSCYLGLQEISAIRATIDSTAATLQNCFRYR